MQGFYRVPLAADRVYLAGDVATPTGGLLPHPFTMTYFLRSLGYLLSVALALRSLWPSVRWSPALRAARTFLSRQDAASCYLLTFAIIITFLG